MTSIDFILLNLKIISRISENHEISRSKSNENGHGIILSKRKYYSPLSRLFFGDSRDRVLEDISSIIHMAISKNADIINSTPFKKNNNKNININESFIISKLDDEYNECMNNVVSIKNDISNCISGLENLKKKYILDITVCARISILIEKINNHCIFIDKKLL